MSKSVPGLIILLLILLGSALGYAESEDKAIQVTDDASKQIAYRLSIHYTADLKNELTPCG